MIMLYMYQIFSSLLGHLYFFVHFFFTFMEYFFFDHPISFEIVSENYHEIFFMWLLINSNVCTTNLVAYE